MQVHYFYGMKTFVVIADRAFVVTVASATVVVDMAFEVVFRTTGTGTKVALAAID